MIPLVRKPVSPKCLIQLPAVSHFSSRLTNIFAAMVQLLDLMIVTGLPLLTSASTSSEHLSLDRRQDQPTYNISSPPCRLPVWIAHDLLWKNATNHLDCGSKAVQFSHLCYTGMPRQPPGYGPPDTFKVTIEGIGPCRQSNPGSVPPRQIGSGYIRCGSSAPTLFFQGTSNLPSSTGYFRVNQQFSCPDGVDEDGDEKVKGFTASGEATFKLKCEHDKDRNATCRADPPEFKIPVTGLRAIYRRTLWD
jgi:hypothetical protein